MLTKVLILYLMLAMKITSAQKENITKELQRVIGQLKDMGAKKIILFGSLAKGEEGLGSDIDLLALFQDKDNFKNRMKWVYDKIECAEAFDLLVYNFDEFERIKEKPFFRHILSYGRVIYEAETPRGSKKMA